MALKNKKVQTGLFFLFSIAIKYITFPYILLITPNRRQAKIVFLALALIITYLSLQEIQPWYFLAFFALLPFLEDLLSNLNIFFLGLLMSYYPYVRFSEWGEAKSILMKHEIIVVFFTINLLYLFFRKVIPQKMKFGF